MTAKPKHWALVAALAIACGDETSMETPTRGGVAPGSGALTVGVLDATAAPVAGAEVFVDGVAAGRTDARGVLQVPDAAPVVDLSVAAGADRVTWLGVAGRDVRMPLPATDPAPAAMRDVTFATAPAPVGVRRELRVGVVRPLVAETGAALSSAPHASCDASRQPCTVSLGLPAGASQVFGVVVDVGEDGERPVAIAHAALDDAPGVVTLAAVPTVRRGVRLPAPLAEAPFEIAGVIGVPGLSLGAAGVWVVPVAVVSGDEVMLPALEGSFAEGRHWLFARQDGADGAFAETRIIAPDDGVLAPPDFLPAPRAALDGGGLRWEVGPGVLVEAVSANVALLWLDATRGAEAPGPLSVTAYELPFAPDSLRLEARALAARRTSVRWRATALR